MGVMIQGVRIKNFSVTRDTEKGIMKLEGDYELISTTGVVLAKQGFNGYGEIEIKGSVDTNKLVNDLIATIQKDIENVLGFTTKGGE